MTSYLMKLFLLLVMSSCSSEHSLDHLEMFEYIKNHDPHLRLVVEGGLTKKIVDCSLYRPQCENGYKAKVLELEVIALKYSTQKEAIESARFIQGYQLYNWSFDQVSGEPVLERFFEEKIKAKSFKKE